MHIVVRFSFSRSFFYKDQLLPRTVKKCALNQNKNANIVANRYAGIFRCSQNFGNSEIGGPRLNFFNLMVNPRLVCLFDLTQ